MKALKKVSSSQYKAVESYLYLVFIGVKIFNYLKAEGRKSVKTEIPKMSEKIQTWVDSTSEGQRTQAPGNGRCPPQTVHNCKQSELWELLS